jgi:hypothetical protein
MTKTLQASDLVQFTGSETFFRHPLNRKVVFTEGAHHVAEAGGAFWLLDEIALVQPFEPQLAREEYQVWKLTVRPDRSATLTCEDGNRNVLLTKAIPFTDFPLDEITLWFAKPYDLPAKRALGRRLRARWGDPPGAVIACGDSLRARSAYGA